MVAWLAWFSFPGMHSEQWCFCLFPGFSSSAEFRLAQEKYHQIRVVWQLCLLQIGGQHAQLTHVHVASNPTSHWIAESPSPHSIQVCMLFSAQDVASVATTTMVRWRCERGEKQTHLLPAHHPVKLGWFCVLGCFRYVWKAFPEDFVLWVRKTPAN